MSMPEKVMCVEFLHTANQFESGHLVDSNTSQLSLGPTCSEAAILLFYALKHKIHLGFSRDEVRGGGPGSAYFSLTLN